MTLRILLLIALLAVLAGVADVAAAAVMLGPVTVWRMLVWRHERPDDDKRFPARPIAASTTPMAFPVDPDGTAAVRAAFATAGIPAAHPGESLEDFARRTGTTSLVVLSHGRLLYEGYFNGVTRQTAVPSFSMAKSVTSLLIGAAIADHRIAGLDVPVAALLPDIPGLRGSGITLRNLLTMTSGLRLDDSHPFGPYSVPWTDGRRAYFAADLRRVMRWVKPGTPPGTRFVYDDRNAVLLGLILERVTGESVSAWMQRVLWQKLGAQYPAAWNLDSRADGMEKMESGIDARPLDFLKIGEMVRRDGIALDGTRVLPESWIAATMQQPTTGPDATLPDDRFYTMMWWGLKRPAGPADIFADGIFGQIMLISPTDHMVLLRTGTRTTLDWPRALQRLADRLAAPPL